MIFLHAWQVNAPVLEAGIFGANTRSRYMRLSSPGPSFWYSAKYSPQLSQKILRKREYPPLAFLYLSFFSVNFVCICFSVKGPTLPAVLSQGSLQIKTNRFSLVSQLAKTPNTPVKSYGKILFRILWSPITTGKYKKRQKIYFVQRVAGMRQSDTAAAGGRGGFRIPAVRRSRSRDETDSGEPATRSAKSRERFCWMFACMRCRISDMGEGSPIGEP